MQRVIFERFVHGYACRLKARVAVAVAGAFVLLAGGFASLLLAGTAHAQQPAESPVPDGAQVEEVAGGFQFTEGPYWNAESGTLLFSDIPANTVYEWHPEADSMSVYRRPSGNSNGIVAGPDDGTLLLAQHGWRRVAHVAPDGQETVLASHYNGNRLNSPNDMAVAEDGTIYFTDPPYGVEEDARELDFSGVYRLPPARSADSSDGSSEPVLLTKAFGRPNGIVLAPDGDRLYVNDSRERLIRVYDMDAGGTAGNVELFARLDDPDAQGGADGMTIDTEGRVYSTGPGGLWIFAPSGEQLARVSVPGQTTNVTFGGAENRTLFITAGARIFRLRVEATGVQ